MGSEAVKKAATFVAVCVAQVMVLNHIHLAGCALPLLQVYIILLFRRGYPKWGVLLWGFFAGIVTDIFANTIGIGAASMTLAAALQPYILQMFIPKDAASELKPTLKDLGWLKYSVYAFVVIFIFVAAYFSLETFSLSNKGLWLSSVLASTALTLVLVLTIESVRKR